MIELDVVFSAGDEVQGLFPCPQFAYLYFRYFNMLTSPVGIRAGIGIGDWSIKTNSQLSTEQDGSAYHNARYAIEKTDESLDYSILLFSGHERDVYINSLMSSETMLVNRQSEYQNELFLLTELMYPISVGHDFLVDSLGELGFLLEQKNRMNYYSRWKSSRSIQRYPTSVFPNRYFNCKPIVVSERAESFYESSGKIRGLASRLSELLETSTQSINKSIRTGNIYQIRNFTIITLRMMDEYFGGYRY
jgi:hypothetical protein